MKADAWQAGVRACAEDGCAFVLATILATSGSAPRGAGTKMVIRAERTYDTIGGGRLELMVIERARALLADGRDAQRIEHVPLAAAAQQCCGGSVTMLLEAFAAATLRVAVFGAGHVGAEVVDLLGRLDARVVWFDSRVERAALYPGRCEHREDPVAAVAALPLDTQPLVLTHDHQLDYALVRALLRRGFVSVGLIGSTTKWQRFRARLAQEGLSDAELGRVRCPVGVRDVRRKAPVAVALSIVTELLQLEADTAPSDLSWRQIRAALVKDSGDD